MARLVCASCGAEYDPWEKECLCPHAERTPERPFLLSSNEPSGGRRPEAVRRGGKGK